MRACNCLNIQIEASSDDLVEVMLDTLSLSAAERVDAFFLQDLQRLKATARVRQVVPALVRTRSVGAWMICRCMNCNMHTHALHKEKGDLYVLVASSLLKSDSVSKIQSSDILSPIFQIVINPNNVDLGSGSMDTYLIPDAQQIIKSIGQVCSDVLRKESLAVEDNIRRYQEEQYLHLNNVKDKAFKEQQFLFSVVKNEFDSTNAKGLKLAHSVRLEEGADVVPMKMTAKLPNASPKVRAGVRTTAPPPPLAHAPSLDAVGVFDFDGADEAVHSSDEGYSVPGSDADADADADESDKEDHREDGPMGRGRTWSMNIAKSLPVDIPAFFTTPSLLSDGDNFEDSVEVNPVDIAANIQALAKSVHGDAVFGDRPRPRFSHQY